MGLDACGTPGDRTGAPQARKPAGSSRGVGAPMSSYDPASDGWRTMPRAPLPGGLGVPWAKRVDGLWRYGLLTEGDQGNPHGVVHGGVLMAFADHGLSFRAWEAAGRAQCTTIQL